MKKFVILLLVMFGWKLSAQVVLTQSSFPTVGTTVTRTVDTTDVSFVPGTAGTGNVWNYGGLNSHYTVTYSFVNPSSTPYASDFPTANLSVTTGNGVYTYFNVSNSIAEEQGFAGEGSSLMPQYPQLADSNIIAKYNQPLTVMPFPSQFGTTFSDSCYTLAIYPASLFGIPGAQLVRLFRNIHRSGNFDASGSLTVNTENWQNALRLRRNEVYFDTISVYSSGQWTNVSSSSSKTYTYEWFVNGQNFPVFNAETDSMGNIAFDRTYYVSATSKSQVSSSIFSVYPNPASDFIQFTGDLTNVQNIVIYNTLGQKQNTSCVIKNQQAEVTLNGLSNGVYIYQIIGKDTKIISSGKFVVEK